MKLKRIVVTLLTICLLLPNLVFAEMTFSEFSTVSTIIGAPGEGLSPNYKGYEFFFNVNSANGVSITWIAKNNSGKEIKYYTLNFSMYNPVEDPAYCTIKKTNKVPLHFVGPVPIDGTLVAFKNILGYTAICSTIVLDTIDLEYMDGTKETVEYGYSTTDKRKE